MVNKCLWWAAIQVSAFTIYLYLTYIQVCVYYVSIIYRKQESPIFFDKFARSKHTYKYIQPNYHYSTDLHGVLCYMVSSEGIIAIETLCLAVPGMGVAYIDLGLALRCGKIQIIECIHRSFCLDHNNVCLGLWLSLFSLECLIFYDSLYG